MLITTVTLDAFALEVALRPVRKQAAGRGVSLWYHLRGNTDPEGSQLRSSRAHRGHPAICASFPGGAQPHRPEPHPARQFRA